MTQKKTAGVAVVGVTEDQVKALILAAISEVLKGLVSQRQFELEIVDMTQKLLTREQDILMINESLALLVSEERVLLITDEIGKSVAERLMQIPNEDRIRELIAESYRSVVSVPTLLPATIETAEEVDLFDETLIEGLEIDGRPMTTDDILSGVMHGDVVTIVSRAGQKHTITRA